MRKLALVALLLVGCTGGGLPLPDAPTVTVDMSPAAPDATPAPDADTCKVECLPQLGAQCTPCGPHPPPSCPSCTCSYGIADGWRWHPCAN